MALLEGLRTGAALVSQYKQNQRLDEDQAWENEGRKRTRKDLDELEAIKSAGIEAFKAEQEGMPRMGAEPTGAPTAPPAAGMEPVATAMPVAAPGSGQAPSGENLAMEPVTGPTPPSPPPEEPRQHPPPPGSTLRPDEVPSQASLMFRGGQPGAQPGEQGQPGMAKRPTRDQMEVANQVLMAQSKKALELGRTKDALAYHTQGMQLRDVLRGKALDEAEQKFRSTGDVAAFVPVFNRYVANGTSVESLTKEGDGYALKGKTDEGKTFEQKLSPSQMNQYLEFLRNPQAARAMEAKRADDIAKHKRELIEKREEKRIVNVAPGGTVLDTQTGGSFTAPQKDPTGQYSFHSVKDADGAETGIAFDKTDGTTRPVVNGQVVQSRGQPKQVVAMQKEASGAVFKANGAESDMFEGLDDNKKAKILTQVQTASDLVAANYGTDNWSGLSAARAASISQGLADGSLKPVQMKIPGYEQPVKGVVFDGRKYLLDPNVGAPARSSGAEFNRSPTVAASAAQQPKRDSDRLAILNDELKAARQLLASAQTDEQKQRAQVVIDAISRELGMPKAKAQGPSQSGIGTGKVSGRIQ